MEKMTDTTSSTDTPLQLLIKDTVKKQMETGVKESINQIYKADIGAIRNLSTISQNLQTKDGIIIPGNLTVRGSFNYLPKGSIIAYNKTIAPEGWALCDGKNGTPDLRGRFIYGAGSSGYELNKRGGETSHTLTIAEIPSHNHSMKAGGNHSHNKKVKSLCYRNGGCANVYSYSGNYGDGTYKNVKVDSAGNHTHTINNTGSSKAHNNMPPFYVLSYIIKL